MPEGDENVLRIAVCDDTREECDFIVEYASVFFEGRQMAVHIDTYEKGSELIEAGQEYDLYLLDVLMPGLTGIETAARLGKGNHAVVFITSSLEAAVDGYSVNAAGFILKPVERNHFEATMERVVNQYLGEREACISVIHNRVPVHLKLERIAWFENRLHRVFVTLTSGETLAIGQKLSELQEELKEHPQFLRCHQSYVVNLEQVERLEDSCFHMREGQLIPISRNFYKQSKNAYYHHRLK
nr:LytTR family DNA-binding domain-containing protein [Enterocloster citroniae]